MNSTEEQECSSVDACMLGGKQQAANASNGNAPPSDETHYPTAGSAAKGIFAQCLLTGAVMLTTASCGMPIGYSAILLPQLEASNGSMHIDDNIGSWIASMHSAGTPLGSFVSGLLMDRYGRKVALQLAVGPLIIGWIIIAFASNHGWLLAGRFIAGSTVGLAAAPGQVIIGEISQPFVRGIFSSVPFASYAFGILLVYALGSVLDWRYVAGLSIILPVLSLVSFFFLPESPVWLVRQGHIDRAKKSLTWLRGGDYLQAKRETDQLVARIDNENMQQTQVKSPSLWPMLLQPEILKPLVIVNIFNLLQVFSGTYIVVFYAVDVIQHMGDTSIDKFLAAVLTSGVRFLFSIVASALLIVLGRRPLSLISGVGTAVTALALGCVMYTNASNSSGSIAGLLVLLYVAANTVGFMIVPAVMLGELYPAKVRGFAGGLTFMVFHMALFTTTKLFPMLKHAVGLHGVFWIFGAWSLVACVFLYLALPETKGRTLNQIEDYFLEKNILWVTRDREWERKNLRENRVP